ncbi:hypothetical protein OUZ56_005456 [Daphnia magna]|uniref:Uncharacterized protein n=1 Tax=Daphnia magna TaxID=35525 RepID=A0ABQ9YT25_9CRUS|nr:hypothetical protein OUZ56_005456 [Daphnia magna]
MVFAAKTEDLYAVSLGPIPSHSPANSNCSSFPCHLDAELWTLKDILDRLVLRRPVLQIDSNTFDITSCAFNHHLVPYFELSYEWLHKYVD